MPRSERKELFHAVFFLVDDQTVFVFPINFHILKFTPSAVIHLRRFLFNFEKNQVDFAARMNINGGITAESP